MLQFEVLKTIVTKTPGEKVGIPTFRFGIKMRLFENFRIKMDSRQIKMGNGSGLISGTENLE